MTTLHGLQHYQCWTVYTRCNTCSPGVWRTDSSLSKPGKKGTAEARSLQHVMSHLLAVLRTLHGRHFERQPESTRMVQDVCVLCQLTDTKTAPRRANSVGCDGVRCSARERRQFAVAPTLRREHSEDFSSSLYLSLNSSHLPSLIAQ